MPDFVARPPPILGLHLCARKVNATISEAHGPVIHRFIILILRVHGTVDSARRGSN